MPRFFVCSDIHSFYTPLKNALGAAGFDINNPDHWLISCGDAFDRGYESEEVLHFLMSLERKILVKGNHDLLLDDLCMREFPYNHDFSNGTTRTVNDIGGAGEGYAFDKCCENTWNRTAAYRASLVNYFETKNYIFVHSWIPVINKDGLPAHYTKGRKFEFDPDWRNATQKEWNDAMWGNPFDMADRGFMPDKTVVFGHWHCSIGWAKSEGRSEFDNDAKFDPYYGDGFISIDACTAYSRKCNVVVIEDEFLEDDNNGNN
jgi:serine/threonine protein phosphatase 1